jgi:phosphate transport system substrate-binding protein
MYGNLVDHQIAVNAFTLIVNNDLKGKVDNLTSDQILKVYAGTYTNWSQIGGPNEAATVVNRPANTNARSTFERYVLHSTNEISGNTLTQDNSGATVAAASATPGSIGYISTGLSTSDASQQDLAQVSPICPDGHKATATDISSGTHAFWTIEHTYTKGPATGAARGLLRYLLSTDAQTHDVTAYNYISIAGISSAAINSHAPVGSPAPETLS